MRDTKVQGHLSVWCPGVSWVVSQAVVRITSGFGLTVANGLGRRRCFPSFLVPLVLSHGVEGYPTGDKHQAVWAFPPFGVTDKLILHSFSRKWFSRRDLGKT